MEIKTNEQFVNLIYPAVIENCKRHGWGVPSAIIAQACLESMKGTGWSGLASSCFNFWGMKWAKKYGCDYKEYRTGEQKANGTYYTVTAKFCKFPTVEAGVEGYFKFIELNSRYKKVMLCRDFVSYATEIKNAGWATSLQYTQNIINRVISLGLQRFYTAGSEHPAGTERRSGAVLRSDRRCEKAFLCVYKWQYGPEAWHESHNQGHSEHGDLHLAEDPFWVDLWQEQQEHLRFITLPLIISSLIWSLFRVMPAGSFFIALLIIRQKRR